MYLHWYAAQRARWTEERLYKDSPEDDAPTKKKKAALRKMGFAWDFVVFIDYWSLYQVPCASRGLGGGEGKRGRRGGGGGGGGG